MYIEIERYSVSQKLFDLLFSFFAGTNDFFKCFVFLTKYSKHLFWEGKQSIQNLPPRRDRAALTTATCSLTKNRSE